MTSRWVPIAPRPMLICVRSLFNIIQVKKKVNNLALKGLNPFRYLYHHLIYLIHFNTINFCTVIFQINQYINQNKIKQGRWQTTSQADHNFMHGSSSSFSLKRTEP